MFEAGGFSLVPPAFPPLWGSFMKLRIGILKYDEKMEKTAVIFVIANIDFEKMRA